jgi:DNA-binding transcriptional MerR regulator
MREAESEVFDQTIGDIARAAGVDAGTVRDYADLDLIQCKRLSNGTRVFCASASAQVREVLSKRLANKGRRRP